MRCVERPSTMLSPRSPSRHAAYFAGIAGEASRLLKAGTRPGRCDYEQFCNDELSK